MSGDIATAIRAARERLGDKTIGAEPERGVPNKDARVRIVCVGEGREVIRLSDWMHRGALYDALCALEPR
jgi:hypothetical protein